MYPKTPSTQPVQTIFGAGFVPEHHVEGDQRKLPRVDDERRFADFVRSLCGLISGEVRS